MEADGVTGERGHEVERHAKEAGFSVVTVRRAKKTAGVTSRKRAMAGGWIWELAAEGDHENPKMLTSQGMSTFGKFDHLRENGDDGVIL